MSSSLIWRGANGHIEMATGRTVALNRKASSRRSCDVSLEGNRGGDSDRSQHHAHSVTPSLVLQRFGFACSAALATCEKFGSVTGVTPRLRCPGHQNMAFG